MKLISRHTVNLDWSDLFHYLRCLSRLSRPDARREFETGLSRYFGVRHAIAFNSARAGFAFLLECLSLKPGSEIIFPELSFVSFPELVRQAGFTPVFAAVDPETLQISVDDVFRKVTDRTGAIVLLHAYGIPCAADRIAAIARQRNVRVIEDCAMSFGARINERYTGTMGDCGLFSFALGKNFCLSGGGAVITDSDALADRLRRVANNLPAEHAGYDLLALARLALVKMLFSFPVYPVAVYPVLLLLRQCFHRIHARIFMQVKPDSLTAVRRRAALMSAARAEFGLFLLSRIDAMNADLNDRSARIIRKINTGRIRLPTMPKNHYPVHCNLVVSSTDRDLPRKMIWRGIDVRDDYLMLHTADQSVHSAIRFYLPNHCDLDEGQIERLAAVINAAAESG